MRKFLALVLALVMTMSLVTVSAGAATSFVDDAKITNAEAVEVLNAMGILGGYPDGTFRPQATLTRGAGAKMIAYLMLGQEKADKLTATYTVFEDVTDADVLAPYIEWAAAKGIVGGYGNGKFGPYNTLTQYAFGKMLLGALHYDAKVEGYNDPANWEKQVYADATTAGVFNGTEARAACTRDDAARMALGALKADIVGYGTTWDDDATVSLPNGTNISTGAFTQGCYKTGEKLWEEYKDLTYMPSASDVFGRPGHKWTYGPVNALKFEKFYMDKPVAEFTTEVTECDMLVAAGYAKTNTNAAPVYYFDNGDYAGVLNTTDLKHDATCTTEVFGAQGTLTQLFKLADGNFVVTEIDTYLTAVGRVIKTDHNNVGATVLTPYDNDDYTPADANKADNNDGADYDAITVNADLGYAENAMILINKADADATGYATVKNADAYAYKTVGVGAVTEYVAVAGQPTVLTGAKYTGVSADQSVAEVNGTLQKTAKHYDLSACGLSTATTSFTTYDFYVDQYGNLIGDAVIVAPYDFVVIQKAEWQQVVGVLNAGYGDFAAVNAAAELKAYNVFKYDGIIMSDVNGIGVPANATLSQYWQDNVDYYESAPNYGIVKAYALADGRYNFEAVKDVAGKMEVDHQTAASIVKGNPNFASNIADENTVFVVKYLDSALKVAYKSYTGISAMDSVSNAVITAVYDVNGDKDMVYADFVFVDLTDGGYFTQAKNIAFVTKTAKTGTYEGSNLHTYDVYVNGAKITVSSKNDDLFANTGVYELIYDAEGHVLQAVCKFKLTGTETAFDGNNVDGKKIDAAGNLVVDGSYKYDTIKGVSAQNVVLTALNKGLAYANAKIYVVNYSDKNNSDTWTNGDALVSVAPGTAADLRKNAQVVYVEDAATVGYDDAAIIFVMVGTRTAI